MATIHKIIPFINGCDMHVESETEPDIKFLQGSNTH